MFFSPKMKDTEGRRKELEYLLLSSPPSLAKRKDYMTKLMYLVKLRPDVLNIFVEDLKKKVEDMALTIDKEKDLLYIMNAEDYLYFSLL